MDHQKNILVVDDEEMMRNVISSYLEKKGFHVLTAETGTQALEIFINHAVSFVILDLMLPDLSGEKLCMKIREHSGVPIIMLTAKATEEDMLNGLHIGADDYITKPFSLKELYARMEAISRRIFNSSMPLPAKSRWCDEQLNINLEQRELTKNGTSIMLTPIEWELLSAFIKQPNKIFTREELISAAFDIGYDGYDRVIDTHIKNLRRKLEDDPRNPLYIHTVRGIGYKFGGGST